MMNDVAQRRHALLVGLNFASLYILWGSTYLAIRLGVHDLPPALMAASRFLIAGAILFAWLRWRRVPLPPRSLLRPLAITGILLLVGGNYMLTVAEQTVPSGMAAVIIANVPFFMVGIEALRRDGERPTSLAVAGLVIGFGGMLVLMWPKIAAIGVIDLADLRGEAALLAAILFWSIGAIYSKHRVKGIPPLMGVALEMLIAGGVLLGIGLVLGEAPRYHLTLNAALAVGWLVVAGSLIAYSSFIWLLSNVPAAKVATYAYVNPVIAVLLGWLILDERVGGRMAVGTSIVLFGVVIVNVAKVRVRR